MTRSLFGGALLSAGLMAGLSETAAAQEFRIVGSTPRNSNFIGVDFFVFREVLINADFYDESMTRIDSYARTYATPTTVSAYANVNSGEYAAYVLHFNPIRFQVTENARALVSWDFSGDIDDSPGVFVDSHLSVRGPGVAVLGHVADNPVGSEEVLFRAGENYTYFGVAQSLAGQSASSFRIEILSGCDADLDGDGDADADDFFRFLDAFESGDAAICDLDEDSDCDADDFFLFLDAFSSC